MNNSILRTKHNASTKIISVMQNLLQHNRLDYNIGEQNIHINECTGIRSYNKKQRVKEYDKEEAIIALEEYVETLKVATDIRSRDTVKSASEALILMQSI